MVAQWDSYQLTRLIAGRYKSISLPPKKHKERKYLAKFGNNTYRSLAAVSKFYSVFSGHHMFTVEGFSLWYPLILIFLVPSGRTGLAAFRTFYTEPGKF